MYLIHYSWYYFLAPGIAVAADEERLQLSGGSSEEGPDSSQPSPKKRLASKTRRFAKFSQMGVRIGILEDADTDLQVFSPAGEWIY